jgi:hypothetical protein
MHLNPATMDDARALVARAGIAAFQSTSAARGIDQGTVCP